MEHHASSVTKLHLNQPRPQSATLLNASDVKAKTAQLKKANKAESVTLKCSIYVYPCNGGAKKVCPLLVLINVTTPANKYNIRQLKWHHCIL